MIQRINILKKYRTLISVLLLTIKTILALAQMEKEQKQHQQKRTKANNCNCDKLNLRRNYRNVLTMELEVKKLIQDY